MIPAFVSQCATKWHVQAVVAGEPPAFQLRPDTTAGRGRLDQQAAGNEGGKKVHLI